MNTEILQIFEASINNFKNLKQEALSYVVPRAFGTYLLECMERARPAMRPADLIGMRGASGKKRLKSGYISNMISGKIKPPAKLLPALIVKLGLEGKDREKFMWLAALSSSPIAVEREFLTELYT